MNKCGSRERYYGTVETPPPTNFAQKAPRFSTMISGIPIYAEPLLTKTIVVTKKWGRLNRPPKVRTQAKVVASDKIYQFQEPATELRFFGRNDAFELGQTKTITVAHPALIARLKRASQIKKLQ